MQYIAQYVALKQGDEQMNNELQFLKELNINEAFLAKSVFNLHLLIQKQADDVYAAKGLEFPVVVSSTLLFLSSVNKASVTQIAKALDHTHQLAAQRIKILLKLSLIEITEDSKDKRATFYKLTKKGVKQSEVLNNYCLEATIAFNSLSDELGINLQATLNNAIQALNKKTLSERFPSLNKIK